MPSHYPWFVRKDIDGFFGLFIDNLIQILLIIALCRFVCGFPAALIFGRVLPGAAVSILFGNIFYAWQAKNLARKTGRVDITALPYGINTVSLFAYVFFIMAPVYHATGSPEKAWRVGLMACFLSGVIELLGSMVARPIRSITPRAALLAALAGIAMTFISMDFVFRIYARPILALLPMAIILIQYMSRVRYPAGVPGGLAAVLAGTAIYWILIRLNLQECITTKPVTHAALHLPAPTMGALCAGLFSRDVITYASVILPMGVFNVIGSLQNLESAEAAGDRFEELPSLAANGLGSMAAACFGSCFPTTIYIGHPGWKALGARAGYSILNGCMITLLCLLGGIEWIHWLIPMEAGIGILLWIGIIIAAQAFQETPREHALAVAFGFFPCLAAWGLHMVESALRAAGTGIAASTDALGMEAFQNILPITGMIAMEKGMIFTSMILAATAVFIIERKFLAASGWMLIAAACSQFGLIHAFEITEIGHMSKFGLAAAPKFATAYAMIAIFLLLLHRYHRTRRAEKDPARMAP